MQKVKKSHISCLMANRDMKLAVITKTFVPVKPRDCTLSARVFIFTV